MFKPARKNGCSRDGILCRLSGFVTRRLEQTDEFVRILHGEDEFPASYFFDVRYSLKRIRPEGFPWLDERAIRPETFAPDNQRYYRFFRPFPGRGEEIKYPALTALAGDIQVFPQLIGKIDAILDKFGRVKDNASSSASADTKEITATMSGISRSLQSILRAAQSEGIIDKDITPSMRDGRLMIPVAPAPGGRSKGSCTMNRLAARLFSSSRKSSWRQITASASWEGDERKES